MIVEKNFHESGKPKRKYLRALKRKYKGYGSGGVIYEMSEDRGEEKNLEMLTKLVNEKEAQRKDHKLQRAIGFATEKHKGQTRKDGKTPYITHPMAVMSLVKRFTDDERVWCAAVLHDTVEDCGVKLEEIEKLFGKPVAKLVKELSKNHTKYENISSREGLLIKMADDLHNVSTIPEGDDKLLKKKQMKIKKTFFKEALKNV